MGIKKLSVASAVGPKGNTAWDGTTINIGTDPGAFNSIATYAVTSGTTTSITLSSIPSTYTHLQLRIYLQSTSAVDIGLRFNGDTGTNYSYHGMYGDGTNPLILAGSGNSKDHAYIGYGAVGSSAFNCAIVDILDYANPNKLKIVRSNHGVDYTTNGFVMLNTGSWNSGSTITSVTVYGGTYNAGTHIALYGVK